VTILKVVILVVKMKQNNKISSIAKRWSFRSTWYLHSAYSNTDFLTVTSIIKLIACYCWLFSNFHQLEHLNRE